MSLRILPLMAVLAFGLNTTTQAADEIKDPTGTWKWEYDYGQGAINSTLVLKNKDGKLSGYYDNGESRVDIKKGEFKDDQFKVEFPLDIDGQSINVTLNGEVTDDELEGQITVDIGGEILEFDWEADRGLLVSDVVGTWELKINSPDGQIFTPKLTIVEKEGKLTGTYESTEVGKFDLTEVEIEDGQLEFEVTVELDGNELALEFEGNARGNNLSGELEYEVAGQTGEAEFSGKRVKSKTTGKE